MFNIEKLNEMEEIYSLRHWCNETTSEFEFDNVLEEVVTFLPCMKKLICYDSKVVEIALEDKIEIIWSAMCLMSYHESWNRKTYKDK
jgi:hypothetical protein